MLQAPPAWLAAWEPVREFVRRVERALPADAIATSWWRGLAENARVGGHPYSQHLLGTAADWLPHPEIAARARAAGLVVVDEGDHVHTQLYPAGSLNFVVDYVRGWL